MKNIESVPTPIEQGEKIRLDKLDQQISEKLTEINSLHQRLSVIVSEKQKLLDSENKKSSEEMDFELTLSLQSDINELEKDRDVIIDANTRGIALQIEVREKLMNFQELIETLQLKAIEEKYRD